MKASRYVLIALLMTLLSGMIRAQSPFLNTVWESQKSHTLKETRAASGEVHFLTLIHAKEVRAFVSDFDRDYERFKNLETIVFMPGSMSVLPAELGRLTSLKVCIIAHDPGIDYDRSLKVLARIPSLYKVSIRGLTQAPPALGVLTQIQQLDLSGGQFKSLPHEMAALNITSLDLSRCVHISDSALAVLKELKTLRALNLFGTGLTALPEHALDIPTLTYLDISDNRITTLQCLGKGSIAAPLKELWMSWNPVKTVDKDFFQCFGNPPQIRILPIMGMDIKTQGIFINQLSQDFGTGKFF